jgi:hypothetical protein
LLRVYGIRRGPESKRTFEAAMNRDGGAKSEIPLYDFAFCLSGWDRAYEAAIERLAFETAAKCTNSYEPVTYFDAVAASIDHPRAKSEIVCRFLAGARDLANKELGLLLDVEMTRYDGEYGRSGTAYGRIDAHMTTGEIVDTVSAVLSAKCGTIVELEGDIEQSYLLDWCLESVEIADARDINHVPEGDVATAIAERLQGSGVVLECLRSALDPRALWRRLADPDRVAADFKYRARAVYF